MAGMLPGVECARRRRMHQGGSTELQNGTGTRRSSFCLYASSHDSHMLQRSFTVTTQSFHPELLGDAAREAKERLDEKLKTQRSSQIKRGTASIGRAKEEEAHGGSPWVIMSSLWKEVFRTKKKMKGTSKRSVMAGAESELPPSPEQEGEEECVVCLEGFRSGEVLVHLPCAHRYHSGCLGPWLQTNARSCPYCRTEILLCNEHAGEDEAGSSASTSS